jgi:multiple antibiotic resistance protein
MVVHPPGEVKASKDLCSCPSNAPLRPIVAITQLPDLGLKIGVFFLMLLIALAITYGTLMLVEPLGRILGVTGTNVIARISGILLAALAVQFIFNGIRDSHLLG